MSGLFTFPSRIGVGLPGLTRAFPPGVAGNCEAGWRTIIARLAFSFHAAAHAFHNPRRRVSQAYPRHSQASVMINHHTEGLGNVRNPFGA